MKNSLYQGVIGYKCWMKNGTNHRIGSAAFIYSNGDRRYFNNGMLHKLNGPAIICYDNSYWYISGNDITNELYRYCHINNINIFDYQNLFISDKLKLKIKFGLHL